MVHAAVADCDVAAARALDARDARQVQARLADQVAAHLEVELRASRARIRTRAARARAPPRRRRPARPASSCRHGRGCRSRHRIRAPRGADRTAAPRLPKMRAKMPRFSPIAFASTHCVPEYAWKPMSLRFASLRIAATASGASSSSTPNCVGLPAMLIPKPRGSVAGAMRSSTGWIRPCSAASAFTSSASRTDSTHQLGDAGQTPTPPAPSDACRGP